MHNTSLVLDRLQTVFGVSTDTDLAEKLGVKRATLGAWRTRESTPYAECINIAESRNISLDWLLTGKGDMQFEGSSNHNDLDTLVHIPEFDVFLSAGNGSYPQEGSRPIDERPFTKAWLSEKGLKHKDLSLVKVRGDSMEPLLKDRDIIMLDSSKTTPNDFSPFAVRIEDCLYIKIVQKNKNILTLHSINEAYKPITINLEEDDCSILGAVVWHSHSWI